MIANDNELVSLLREIRDLLEPISENSRSQFLEGKLAQLRSIVTPKNRKALPFLLDPRGLTQKEIADSSGASQPTVSRLITDLKQANLIEELSVNGKSLFKDKHKLFDKLDVINE